MNRGRKCITVTCQPVINANKMKGALSKETNTDMSWGKKSLPFSDTAQAHAFVSLMTVLTLCVSLRVLILTYTKYTSACQSHKKQSHTSASLHVIVNNFLPRVFQKPSLYSHEEMSCHGSKMLV